MEVLVWLFVGLMAFVAWLFFITYRLDERNRTGRHLELERRREWQRRHDQAFWARAEQETARMRERAARAGRPLAEPEREGD